MWNPDLNINGGWDNQEHITKVYGDDILLTCHATKVSLRIKTNFIYLAKGINEFSFDA